MIKIVFLLSLAICSLGAYAQNASDSHTPDWEIYFSFVDEKPSTIVCDLGLEGVAPLAGFPICAGIGVAIRKLRDNGFPEATELERLTAAEEQIVNGLETATQSIYAGRTLSDGEMTLFFYIADSLDFGRKASSALRQHLPSDEAEISFLPDPDWSVFSDLLFPDDEAMNGIQNNRLLLELENSGDQHDQPRTVHHSAVFKTAQAREVFGKKIMGMGFLIERRDTNEGAMPFELYFARTDNLEEEHLNRITLQLFTIADTQNGFYDGWECAVVK